MKKILSVFLSMSLLVIAANSFANPALASTKVQKQKQFYDDTSPQLQQVVATDMLVEQTFWVTNTEPVPLDIPMQVAENQALQQQTSMNESMLKVPDDTGQQLIQNVEHPEASITDTGQKMKAADNQQKQLGTSVPAD